ncbi:MAG TPA: hypothetical protein VMU50_10855 [Polyangia bacterium]|nr:hypothetical protein [Polyangia bacterium]
MKHPRLLDAALLAAAIVVGKPRAALADELISAPPAAESPRATGAVAGSLTVLLPFMAGSLLLADDDRPGRQHAGVYVMAAGFAAAPWVAEVANRRWKRAVGFGLLSLATSAATVIAMEERDPFDPTLPNRKRLPFGVLLTSAFFAAAAGVIDSFVTGPRERRP